MSRNAPTAIKKKIHADCYVIVMKCPVKSKRKLSIYNTGVRVCVGNIFLGSDLWPAICFKIMTRYTCGVLPRIFAIFCPVGYFSSICPFSSHASVSTQTYAKQAPIYLCYKQTCVYGVIADRRIKGIELYRWQYSYFY